METEKRKEFNSLIKASKMIEAEKVLNTVWALEGRCWNRKDFLNGNYSKNLPVDTEPEVKIETKDVEDTGIPMKESDNIVITPIRTLSKIKGIGKKTVKDIESVFNSVEDLKDALMNGEDMPFRDDVVEKLSKELL